MGECFFWYWLTRVVLDKGPSNGCACVCGYGCSRDIIRGEITVGCKTQKSVSWHESVCVCVLEGTGVVSLAAKSACQWWRHGRPADTFVERQQRRVSTEHRDQLTGNAALRYYLYSSCLQCFDAVIYFLVEYTDQFWVFFCDRWISMLPCYAKYYTYTSFSYHFVMAHHLTVYSERESGAGR